MRKIEISSDIKYIGADDKTLDLFESQYVLPNGISYNSYLIKDEKNVVMDTVDKRATDEWKEKLEKNLNGEKVDLIRYSENAEEFIANALSPAKNLTVNILDPMKKEALVIVTDDNLSLAIGKKGSNIKLASKLTKYKIEIKTLAQINEEGNKSTNL